MSVKLSHKSHLLLLFLLLLLLLLVFNIYALAVVITVISSVRRVITNDQRLTEYSCLYIFNTFLSILAVPNKALFCITPTLHVMPSFPIHLSNFAETPPRASITTGTIFTFLSFHNLLISFFKSWYFIIIIIIFFSGKIIIIKLNSVSLSKHFRLKTVLTKMEQHFQTLSSCLEFP